MVGLPARGKTYVAHKIKHYFEFFHSAPTAVFNAGQTRRRLLGAKHSHNFFDPKNEKGVQLREDMAKRTLKDLVEWLKEKNKNDALGRVAIYDATNNTRKRRKWIVEQLSPVLQSRRHLIFIETICEDKKLVEHNIRSAKLTMPDYAGLTEEQAILDFKKRIEHYSISYEPLDDKHDDTLSYIKMYNGGDCLTMNRIKGNLPGRLVTLLMNLHTYTRPIYLSRHGKSLYNVQGRIGGDSHLSKEGVNYAKVLAKYVENKILTSTENPEINAKHARLYTSTMQRSIQTTKFIKHNVQKDGWVTMRPRRLAALDELYAGKFDGMSQQDIAEQAPEETKRRDKDKLNYRYPRGESYSDAIERVQLVALQLERHRDPVLVVAHNGIIRILYAYFKGLSREMAPHVKVPFDTVIKLVPKPYNCEETRNVLLKPEFISSSRSDTTADRVKSKSE
uniref:6-phosphofructo-2-kinase domain-containing protein n=1 Tax=Amorphochlora amoebiformis TaxID=1561963 RepID=A0A7S0HA45_9EUKA